MKKSEIFHKIISSQKSFFNLSYLIKFLFVFLDKDGGSEGDRTPVQKQNAYSLYTLSKSENFI